MTDTKQTMRNTLRQHGLPEAWAEWVREMATEYTRESMVAIVEIRGPGMWCKFDIKDGEPPWWMRDKVPGFVAGCTFADVKPRQPPPKPPVYIAGKFRGPSHWDIAQNIRRAEAVALAAWRSGLFSWVYCPHANTAHFQDAAPDEVWIEGHLEAMRAVHREGGVVLVLRDWPRSSGTRAELEEAHRIGMPAFESQLDGPCAEAASEARLMSRVYDEAIWWTSPDAQTLATYLTERAGRGK